MNKKFFDLEICCAKAIPKDNPIKNSRLGNLDLQQNKIKMEIYLNFNKPQISEKVIKFLEANIPNEEVKKHG